MVLVDKLLKRILLLIDRGKIWLLNGSISLPDSSHRTFLIFPCDFFGSRLLSLLFLGIFSFLICTIINLFLLNFLHNLRLLNILNLAVKIATQIHNIFVCGDLLIHFKITMRFEVITVITAMGQSALLVCITVMLCLLENTCQVSLSHWIKLFVVK